MLVRSLVLVLASWLGLLPLPAAQAQALLNLGLEPGANHGHPLVLWMRRRAPGAQVQLDSTLRRQGRGSLRLTLAADDDERVFAAVYTAAFPLDSLRGQLATVSGWVRTRGFRGRAGLYAFAHTATTVGTSADHAFAVDSLPADMDWRRFEVRLPVKPTAQDFGVGLQAYGNGRVWFDDVQVRVGGRRVGTEPLPGTEGLFLTAAEALTPNWDFERPLPPLARPNLAQATATLDSAQPQHGRRYLRLARVGTASPVPAVYLGALRLDSALIGKTLQVQGYWRQARSATQPAETPALAYTLLSTDRGSNYYNDSPTSWSAGRLQTLPPPPAPGPAWTAFAFTIAVPDDYARLAALALSLRLPGGTVDVDNLHFTLNGAPYVPAPPPAPPAPSPAETAWLRASARPLRLGSPATEAADLAALGTALASARLVGVGEVTHGSHESYALHDRIIRYLMGQKGFTGLALEASPVACAALTEYVRTGRGDPARLLAALDGWPAAELLDLVRWLRAYQQAHPATPLLLAGLDVQQPELALAALGQLATADDDFAQTRLRQLARLLAAYPHPAADDPDLRRAPDQPHDSLLAPLRRLVAELSAGLDTRAKLRGRPVSLTQLARQRYYLRLVEQGATWRWLSFGLAFNYRQACLAENAQYLSQTEGPAGAPARLVLWASNTAVAKALGPEEHPMGEWLRATLGTGYIALGLALGQGSYAALDAAGHWRPAPLATPLSGTYEAWLRTGPPASWLRLSRLELTDENAWLFQSQLLRDVGWPAARNQFMLHSLRGEFDAVVFLRDSTPAHFSP